MPCGGVSVITPFNFPLEIPLLQLMGALYMGNKPVLKCDSRNSVVMEQTLRLLHACGMPAADVDFLNADGPATQALLHKAPVRASEPCRRHERPPRRCTATHLLCATTRRAGLDWRRAPHRAEPCRGVP